MLVDTHAHLQWTSFDKDREDVIKRARDAGVEVAINIGFDIDGSKEAIRLAEEYEGLYATVGIHPHNASQFSQAILNNIENLAKDPKVVAIGEIGLDYYRNLSPRRAQKEAFEAQLLLAQQLELPVAIHDRESLSDVLKILSKFKGKISGVMHCFSGSREMAKECISSGFYISFAGPITYPNAHKLQRVAEWIDLNKILIETDSPWLAPQAMRGRRNEPAFLSFIAERIADLKGISLNELAEVTTENAKRVFRLP